MSAAVCGVHCCCNLQDDLRTAFLAYFKVGQSSGKTLKRFDELMQASSLWLSMGARVVCICARVCVQQRQQH